MGFPERTGTFWDWAELIFVITRAVPTVFSVHPYVSCFVSLKFVSHPSSSVFSVHPYVSCFVSLEFVSHPSSSVFYVHLYVSCFVSLKFGVCTPRVHLFRHKKWGRQKKQKFSYSHSGEGQTQSFVNASWEGFRASDNDNKVYSLLSRTHEKHVLMSENLGKTLKPTKK